MKGFLVKNFEKARKAYAVTGDYLSSIRWILLESKESPYGRRRK